MALTAEQKKEILGQYGLHDTDKARTILAAQG